jgi:hypothetical protein
VEGRYSKGILFVLTNCKDPAQEAEFNRWYNETHLPDVTAPGLLRNASRYRNTASELQAGEARYLAIYETEEEDLAEVRRQVTARGQVLREQGRMHAALEIVLSSMCQEVPHAFWTTSPNNTPKRVTGLFIVTSNCSDPAREREFSDWYTQVHLPDILSTGLFHTAYRYVHTAPQSGQGKYIALYETDADDPARAVAELRNHRHKWVDTGRLSDVLQVVSRATYTRLYPPA